MEEFFTKFMECVQSDRFTHFQASAISPNDWKGDEAVAAAAVDFRKAGFLGPNSGSPGLGVWAIFTHDD